MTTTAPPATPAAAASAGGKMLARDFVYERQLGTGAFSKVMVGLHRPTGARYAVKMISKQTILNAPTDEERARMADVARREAKMLRMCDHPNIVRFYASMQTPEDLVYVTELCDGGELLAQIRQRGRIPLEAARHAIAELFSAVFYLHHGVKRVSTAASTTSASSTSTSSSTSLPSSPRVTIIHRDIKPENIMLSSSYHVKLIDFGTAVACDTASERAEEDGASGGAGAGKGRGRAQTFCGTTYYMSPELLQDSYTCCASDYWGVGCVLYHMLVGRRPFDAATPYLLIKTILEQEPEYGDDLDADAVDLLRRLLVKAPERRIKMDDVLRHPFFATVHFASLASADVRGLWARHTPWLDAAVVDACMCCGRRFRATCRRRRRYRHRRHGDNEYGSNDDDDDSDKDYCRHCGHVCCHDCVQTQCELPDYCYATPQPVCRHCCAAMAATSAPV